MTPIPPIDPVGCRIARVPLRDDDGTILPYTTADLLAAQAKQAAGQTARCEDLARRQRESADRKAVGLANQPTVATVNGYRIVADTDFEGVFHVLDTDGSSIVHGGIGRCRRDAKSFSPAT